MASLYAGEWNSWVDRVARAWPLAGRNCRVRELPGGLALDGDAGSAWEHPWQISAQWHFFTREESPGAAADRLGEWRAEIRPGFVSGLDAFITMPSQDPALDFVDTALTDDPAPWLRLAAWRNPLAPSSIADDGEGNLVFGAGEGYPKAFERLGVKKPAGGGSINSPGASEAEFDPRRTREIRAMDIVLAQPRSSRRLEVRLGDPVLDGQTVFLDTAFNPPAATRTRLRALARFAAPTFEQDLVALFESLLTGGDTGFDELEMATVWAVSPPDAASDAVPDHTWALYPQHFVFWNLAHAPRVTLPETPPAPLQLVVPLAGGVGQPLINAILSTINDAFAGFFNHGDVRGKFWSV